MVELARQREQGMGERIVKKGDIGRGSLESVQDRGRDTGGRGRVEGVRGKEIEKKMGQKGRQGGGEEAGGGGGYWGWLLGGCLLQGPK